MPQSSTFIETLWDYSDIVTELVQLGQTLGLAGRGEAGADDVLFAGRCHISYSLYPMSAYFLDL